MQDQLGAFARGVDSAMCNWFGEHGNALTAVGFGLTLFPEPLSSKVGVGLLLANAAAQGGCTYDQDAPVDSRCMRDVGVLFAYKVAREGYDLMIYDDQGNSKGIVNDNEPNVEIKQVQILQNNLVVFEMINARGEVSQRSFTMAPPVFLGFRIAQDDPDVRAWREVGEPCPGVAPQLAPVQYTDQTTNCSMTIEFDRFIEGEAGAVYVSNKISPSESTRADGGVISGCNFNTSLVVYQIGGGGGVGGGGGDGRPWVAPYPPDADDDFLKQLIAGLIGGATGAAINQVFDAIDDLSVPPFEAGSFTMTAPCDVDDEGEPQYRTWAFEKASFEQRMNAHQVALMEMLQQHLNWKTPTCRTNEKPQLEGTWISTRWESDSNSPAGDRPLRKLFRYRSKSTRDEEQLRQYWADFTWQAGGSIVIHKGAWWGTPKVWAASPEEGQRVLRFAGLEAGIDPDQTGEWIFSSSDSPRYGMPGTMRLEEANGTRWVTRRDGPDGPWT